MERNASIRTGIDRRRLCFFGNYKRGTADCFDTDTDPKPHYDDLEGEEGGDQKQLLCGPQLSLEDRLSELPQEEEEV